jgi:hypothetical protein
MLIILDCIRIRCDMFLHNIRIQGQIKEQYLLDDKGFVKLKEYFLN